MKDMDILIGERVIGFGAAIFVVADIGLSHDGNVGRAVRLIDAAADAGADAVKFHCYRTERLLIPSRDRYAQQVGSRESAHRMLSRCELSWEDLEKLKAHAEQRGVLFLSSPSDRESTDFLDSIGVPVFKMSSADITHLPLLRHVAAKGKPVILSTGMSFLSEVADAVDCLRNGGTSEILLLHCVSAFPAAANEMNLRAIETLRSYFELPVGLSDHSEGILVPMAAAALGAVLIEKHFTLDKAEPELHNKAGLDPAELKTLVKSLREVESSLGDGRKRPSPVEEENRLFTRRSIVAAVDIRAHETISEWMLAFKRPGSGLKPQYREKVIGMTARRNIPKDTILQWEDLAPAAAGASGGVTGNTGLGANPGRERQRESRAG